MSPVLLMALFAGPGADPFQLTLQSRSADGAVATRKESWNPKGMAVIVCDMWDLHHCLNAVRREKEMAPRVNEFLTRCRDAGALIIHSPSDCMKPYADTPARKRAQAAAKAPNLPEGIGAWCKSIPAEEKLKYPIDQSDGGEDDDPAEHAAWAAELKAKGLNPRAPWTRQIDVLKIDQDRDAITDSGTEVWNLLEERGIRNVALVGVHVNMCVAGRPFGLRQLSKNGKNAVLVRDLTDSMYNPARAPMVSHHRGTELFIEHLEKAVCPTITSDQVLGGKPFAFKPVTGKD
ncbi:MAG: cysteine hydrolase [Planctomycetes bacterium]|nr:cysteine hydrolase [Planctomycetota bacterium]